MERWHRIDLDKEKLLKKAVDLHGHIGPYLIMGLIIGREALKRLNLGGYHGFSAEVFCETIPPESCIVDGIQISTGLTTGKMNLAVSESDVCKVVFTRGDGVELTITPRTDILQLCKDTNKGEEEKTARELLFEKSAEDLLDISP